MDESKKMAKIAITALNDKKAEDLKVIDISKVSVMADLFIIASGSNRSQIQAMIDNVQEKLHKEGYDCKQIEGYDTANWILMDYRDIIIHVFDNENRLFYDLERIWRDGVLMEESEF
ncbi:MAG: ribosome silencing factor [Lachnospiraceae bacterium]